MRGACGYAKGLKQSNAGHSVVLLVLTDGEPSTICSRFGLPRRSATRATDENVTPDATVPTWD